jgi:3-hydroxymyristoyl/3-hydroxydecanoyl-(acyl carrier protein) dehydratase
MTDLAVTDLVVSEEGITGRVVIPGNLPAFDGHFPGRPILPGVAQLQLALSLLEHALGRRVHLKRVRRMKFSSTVPPDTALTFRLQPDADGTRLAWSLATSRAEASSGVAEIALETP